MNQRNLIEFLRKTPVGKKIHRKTPVLAFVFYKVAGLKAWNFVKKRLQPKCFSVNIAKF